MQMTGDLLFGMRVVVVGRKPKYQLPLDVPVSPEFREEFNAWALSFFGWVDAIPNLPCVVQGTVLVTHDQYQNLRAQSSVFRLGL